MLRNRPLSAIHPQATKAAIAAECAGKQGKFWEYADALFENQNQLSDEVFGELSRRLNLDSAGFASCQKSDIAAQVQEQVRQAVALEVDSTPTLFLNNKRYTGALPFDELSQLVNQIP